MKSIIFTTTIALALMFLVQIYNYSVPLGDNNDTMIMMYYDEPVTESDWQAMEEADEEEHRDESEEDEDDEDDDDDNNQG